MLRTINNIHKEYSVRLTSAYCNNLVFLNARILLELQTLKIPILHIKTYNGLQEWLLAFIFLTLRYS